MCSDFLRVLLANAFVAKLQAAGLIIYRVATIIYGSWLPDLEQEINYFSRSCAVIVAPNFLALQIMSAHRYFPYSVQNGATCRMV